MNKNIKKRIMQFIIIIITMFILSSLSMASSADIVDKITSTTLNSEAENMATNISGAVLNIAKIIVLGIAIIMLIVLGIKYMISSVEDRAAIKKHAVIYLVGAVIMFSATGIITIIQNFVDTNIN